MIKRRRSYLMVVGLLSTLILPTAFPAGAAEFPTRPVTFICPYPPGGAADAGFRILANAVQKYLDQPIIVEAKVGAIGQIADDYLARRKPDGYSVAHLFYSQTHMEKVALSAPRPTGQPMRKGGR
jgi:tripartite-type tricarboxylate transporter receptor subunit TctC